MKPRLKLCLDGSLLVLAPGALAWTCFEADSFVAQHYGDRMRFALRFRLNYAAVTAALRDDKAAAQRAGQVESVRRILGLRSDPSARSQKLVELHVQRRARREPDWVFGAEVSA